PASAAVAPEGASSRWGEWQQWLPRPGKTRRVRAARDRNLLFADDLRAIVVGPGQHHRARLRRLEFELDVRVGRDRGLEIRREHLFAGDRAGKSVEDLA